jgi:hypothetical protein
MQDLHLIKAQCSTSTLVTKVKIVERCFDDGVTVEFHMHDIAPAAPPAPLPYFANGSDVFSDENAVVKYLVENGAQKLWSGDKILPAAIEAVILESPAVNQAVKLATKSKTLEVWRQCKPRRYIKLKE